MARRLGRRAMAAALALVGAVAPAAADGPIRMDNAVVVHDGDGAWLQGVLTNRSDTPVSAIRLRLTCGHDGTSARTVRVTVTERMVTRIVLNRRTGSYEPSTFQVPDVVGGGQSYRFVRRLGPSADHADCHAPVVVEGWTDAARIFQ